MKKLFMIIAAVLMLCTAAACAEEIDLESMSSADLFRLRGQIDNVISSRQGESSSVIHIGKYVCGEDIREGTYDISFLLTTGPYSYVYVRVDYADGKEHDFCNLWNGETYTFTLNHGDILSVNYGTGILSPSVSADAFWRP